MKFLFVEWLTKSFLGWWWKTISSVTMIQTGIFYRCVLFKNVLQFNYFFSFHSMNNLVEKYNNSIDAYLQRVFSRTCKKTFKITIIIIWHYFTEKEPDTSKWKIGQNAKQFITKAVASHPPTSLQTCRSRSRKTQTL